MFDIVVFLYVTFAPQQIYPNKKPHWRCNGYHRIDNNVRVERHEYPRPVCSVSQHYKKYIQRVGLEQKGHHHIKINFVLAMI